MCEKEYRHSKYIKMFCFSFHNAPELRIYAGINIKSRKEM